MDMVSAQVGGGSSARNMADFLQLCKILQATPYTTYREAWPLLLPSEDICAMSTYPSKFN